ncbi:universal stress protein [Streptomyces sp. NPDC004726]
MPSTVTVGLDGSRESLAAAAWAAREAALRGLPLRLVNVWEPVPMAARATLLGVDTQQHWAERIPREAAQEVRSRHPELDVRIDQLTGRPGEKLAEAAAESALLVLGSRGLSGFSGFLVGSVGQAVLADVKSPVVFVRAPESSSDTEPVTTDGPVVLGLDANEPDDAQIEFAFEAAVRRGTTLRVIHGWTLPPYFAYGLPPDPVLDAELAKQETATLKEVLAPWREKHPDLRVVEESTVGKPVDLLVEAAKEAALLVVGRRIRRAPFGGRIGSVAHAVLHHASAPVVVVPHK